MWPDRIQARRHRVLVVEDCDDDFDTVVEAATHVDLPPRLVRAADAEAAWRLLADEAPGSLAFMLLDYNLPGMDGLAFLGRVRGDPAWAALPVVVFTTSINPNDRDAFGRAGADGFHMKSVQHTDGLRTLAAIFAQWLHCPPPHGTKPRS